MPRDITYHADNNSSITSAQKMSQNTNGNLWTLFSGRRWSVQFLVVVPRWLLNSNKGIDSSQRSHSAPLTPHGAPSKGRRITVHWCKHDSTTARQNHRMTTRQHHSNNFDFLIFID
mmetsp:Transcript_10391/g.24066  ORF Transcript_10391/g.24066 Transcript_10391/m.24066 type:complete len:116 (-) Transcript_10391:1139-1486(-)